MGRSDIIAEGRDSVCQDPKMETNRRPTCVALMNCGRLDRVIGWCRWAGTSLWRSCSGLESTECDGKAEDSRGRPKATLEQALHCHICGFNLRLLRSLSGQRHFFPKPKLDS